VPYSKQQKAINIAPVLWVTVVIDEHIFYYPDFLLIFFLNSFSVHSLHTPLQLLSHLVMHSASQNHGAGREDKGDLIDHAEDASFLLSQVGCSFLRFVCTTQST